MTRFSRRTFGAGALAVAASGLAAGTARAAMPPPSGAYFGVYHYIGNANGISGPEALEAKIGRRFAINHCFQPVDVSFVTEHRARATQDIADGRIPMISWAAGNETRLGEILEGTHDEWISKQVTALAALGTPVLMRFTWEMDLRYLNTALFQDVWRYVRWKFKAGAPNVEFVWCPTWRAYRETNKADAFYPGDDHVDWVAADGYARRNLEKPEYHYRDFNLMFDTAHQFAVDRGKPFMVGETGVNRDDVDPVQAAWLTETHAVIKAEFPNLKAFVYFHRDGSEEDEHWRIDVPDGGPAQEAFTAMATDPYFSAT